MLHALHDWGAIEARIAGHPPGLPRSFTDFSRTLQAESALARNDAASARTLLRTLIWQGDAIHLQRWRLLLVRAYLADDLTEDAYLAMLRYRQDHGDATPELRELGARVLLRAGRPEAALAALGDAADPAADALRLLAELRAGRSSAEAVAASAEAQARALAGDPRAAARYWSVAVTAATLGERGSARIAALEAGLPAEDLPTAEAPFGLAPTDLWEAYRVHGAVLANRAQLLVGQDAAWFAHAREQAEADPLAARTLFATLAQRARDAELRAASHAAFATSLAATPRGPALLARLYLEEDAPAGRAGSLPLALRQQVADAALAAGDTATAGRFYRTLEAPPPDGDAFAWRLRRARLLIASGAVQDGGTALVELVRALPDRALGETGTLLPLVADLQQAGATPAASAVVEQLLRAPQDDVGRQRSLLLTLAALRQAGGEPLRAARLHLHGALLPGTDANDAVGREARHAAVGALVEAGLRDDAIALLDALVADTPRKARAPLEVELARLRGRNR